MFKEKVVGLLWERKSHHLGRFWGPFWKHSLFLIGLLSAAISCWDHFWSLFSAKWGLLLGNKSDTGPSLGRRCLTDSGHPGRKACLPLRQRRLFLLQKFPGAGSGLGREGSLAGSERSCPQLPESKLSSGFLMPPFPALWRKTTDRQRSGRALWWIQGRVSGTLIGDCGPREAGGGQREVGCPVWSVVIVVVYSYAVMSDFVTPWTVARQAPLSMRLLRQGYWSGLPFPSSGDLPNLGIEPTSPAVAGRFFTTELPGKPPVIS